MMYPCIAQNNKNKNKTWGWEKKYWNFKRESNTYGFQNCRKLLQLLAEVFNNTECGFRINYILLSRFLYFEESLMFTKVDLGDIR